MKSAKLAVLFGALSLIFMGCPYESKVPVDDASNAKGDKAFVGSWDEKGEESYLWTVKLDGNQYRIEKKNVKDGGEPTVYIGFLSDVAGTPFLNVYEQSYDSGDRKYYIYKVEKKGEERFKLYAVTDNITEEFATSAELKAFIKKNMELSFFWNKDDEKTYYAH